MSKFIMIGAMLGCGFSHIHLSPDGADGNGAPKQPRNTPDQLTDLLVNTMGLDVIVKVPNSVDNFNINAGRDGACLYEAINNVIYRSYLAEFRPKFAEAIEKKTGIARLTEQDGNKTTEIDDPENPGQKKKVPVMKVIETEAKYFNRVKAELGLEEDAAIANEFGALAQQVADGIEFDASKAEREAPQPKKTPQAYLDAARQIIEAGHGATIAGKLTELLKPATPFEATQESLGKAIQLNEARKAAEARKKVLAETMALAGV